MERVPKGEGGVSPKGMGGGKKRASDITQGTPWMVREKWLIRGKDLIKRGYASGEYEEPRERMG